MVKVLGRGSQGIAYHVKTAENGEYALKLYHTATVDKDKTIHARVKRLVKIGAPSQSSCFWRALISRIHLRNYISEDYATRMFL